MAVLFGTPVQKFLAASVRRCGYLRHIGSSSLYSIIAIVPRIGKGSAEAVVEKKTMFCSTSYDVYTLTCKAIFFLLNSISNWRRVCSYFSEVYDLSTIESRRPSLSGFC